VIHQKLRRAGNSYVVTVPREEVERHGWTEGTILALEIRELRPVLPPELRELWEKSWKRNEAGYRYLADR
jgi:antitoxin component of MazEF toxin-antitoxin module